MESDFLVLHHRDMYELDGPQFCKLASQLIYYKGAVRGKAEVENREPHTDQQRHQYTSEPHERGFQPGQSMSMSEALGNKKRSEFDTLNEESIRAGEGALFEVVKV